MKKKILIVDDSASILNTLRFTLGVAGYEVITASDGLQAVDILHKNSDIDLIVTDLYMPGMDGLELTRKIRSMENFKYHPVVFLTNEFREDRKEEAKKAGATGWIKKPFTMEKFTAVIKKVIR